MQENNEPETAQSEEEFEVEIPRKATVKDKVNNIVASPVENEFISDENFRNQGSFRIILYRLDVETNISNYSYAGGHVADFKTSTMTEPKKEFIVRYCVHYETLDDTEISILDVLNVKTISFYHAHI